MNYLPQPMFEEILAATIRQATPLLLAALGEVVVQRSGVINIGIEGMMLMGAFFGMLGSFYTGIAVPNLAPWIGLVAAGLSGGITAFLFAFLTIRLSADQVVTGTGITLLALGLTEVVYQKLLATPAPRSKLLRSEKSKFPFCLVFLGSARRFFNTTSLFS